MEMDIWEDPGVNATNLDQIALVEHEEDTKHGYLHLDTLKFLNRRVNPNPMCLGSERGTAKEISLPGALWLPFRRKTFSLRVACRI